MIYNPTFNTLLNFDNWAQTNISDTGLRGAIDDPNNNGVQNLLEFALGLTAPSSGKLSALPRATREGNMLKITHRRAIGVSGITTIYETSNDLSNPNNWTRQTPMSEAIVPIDSDAETVTVEIVVPAGTEKIFARVKVTQE